MMRIKEFKVEILDPIGNVAGTHNFFYESGIGNQISVTINGNQHIFTYDGKHKIDENPRPYTCMHCGKTMKPQGEVTYVCMNPECDEFIKIQKQ